MDARIAGPRLPGPESTKSHRLDVFLFLTLTVLLLVVFGLSAGAR
jgi:hypothetical protein